MRNSVKALLFTAIPILILSLVSLFSKQPDLNKGLGIFWLIAGDIWLMALLTAVGFRLKKKERHSIRYSGWGWYRICLPGPHDYDFYRST